MLFLLIRQNASLQSILGLCNFRDYKDICKYEKDVRSILQHNQRHSTYFVRIITADGIIVRKIVKQ